ncbi:B3 domain-containing transcription factor VRN1-like [Cornus florida]|uniref:B3 domain-containing transcription factor VRN1-like n=1 Tax=Cornus florida TaxID=4283 RepID=UPI00289DC5D5|nr:B3 domain-containing transcription factor VRN1-like [Cornus florida]
MASSSHCKSDDKNSLELSFPTRGPRFFKIIHDGIVHDPKLRIPGVFMKNYGKNLSNPVFLNVPSGAEWKVELVHSDGKVWLQNGWQEFKEYYSIGSGHVLVFRYDGNSHFHVLIFDMSASEIEYPISDTHVEQTNNNEGFNIEVDDSVEILNDFPTCQTSEQIHEYEQIDEDVFVRISDDFPTRRTTSKCLKTKIKEECSGRKATTSRHLHTMAPEKRPRVSADEKESAEAYQSKDPFFLVFMQPSYVGGRFNLCIPFEFANKYFTHKQKVILGVSSGRTWSVVCELASGVARLDYGWKSFVEDNHLKAGDVCVFHLIKEGTEPSLKVVIF